MNYEKIYEALIQKRRENPLNHDPLNQRAVHYHHIVPISYGGENTPKRADYNRDGTNLIGLTAKEHFLAHLLLWKIEDQREQKTRNWYKAKYTMQLLIRLGKSSKTYQDTSSEKITGRLYEKIMTGRKHSEETKKKMSASQKGKTISQAQRDYLSSLYKGKPRTKPYPKEAGKKISTKLTGVHQGRIWVNNGIECSRVPKDKIPIGFKPGRLWKPHKKSS